METTHLLSAGEAARSVGVSVAAISRALKTGRLPYVEKTARGYRIDPSTLFHVFRGRGVARANGEAGGSDETGDLLPEVVALRVANARLGAELSAMATLLDAEWNRAEKAERDREGWRTICEWMIAHIGE